MDGGRWPSAVLEDSCRGHPYKIVNELKILGVTFDADLNFPQQVAHTLDGARMRLAISARVAGTSWGLKAGMLRLTHDALVVGLLRYGLLARGSGTYEDRSLRTRRLGVSLGRLVPIA